MRNFFRNSEKKMSGAVSKEIPEVISYGHPWEFLKGSLVQFLMQSHGDTSEEIFWSIRSSISQYKKESLTENLGNQCPGGIRQEINENQSEGKNLFQGMFKRIPGRT